MDKCVIRNTDTGEFLVRVSLERMRYAVSYSFAWTDSRSDALILNHEEASATIDFIRDVFDFELAGSLEVVEV